MGDPYITPAIPQTKARGQLSICPRHGQELVGESPLGWSAGQTMGHSGVPDGNQHEVGRSVLARVGNSALPVQDFTHLLRQALDAEWLLDEIHASAQNAMVRNHIAGIAGHVQNLQPWPS